MAKQIYLQILTTLILIISVFSGFIGKMKITRFDPMISLKALLIISAIIFLTMIPNLIATAVKGKNND